MKYETAKEYSNLLIAIEMLPERAKKEIKDKLKEVDNAPDEIIKNTITAIRITLGEEFQIITKWINQEKLGSITNFKNRNIYANGLECKSSMEEFLNLPQSQTLPLLLPGQKKIEYRLAD